MPEVATGVVSAVVGFVPGGFGGFCNVVVGHPIDLVKVRLQTGAGGVVAAVAPNARSVVGGASPSTAGMLRSIFVKEGVAGLYAGVSAPLIAVVPALSVAFWSFEAFNAIQFKYFPSDHHHRTNQLSMGQIAASGAFSGIPAAFVIGPLERIKCLLQVDHKRKYSGFWDCARKVYAQGGLRSVFRGTALTLMRDVPGNAAYFGTYECMKRYLSALENGGDGTSQGRISVGATLLAGGTAGVANWLVAIPFDTVKSRWQTASSGQYKNAQHVLVQLLQSEGPSGLFRGLSPALLRAFPANAACLLGIETAKSFLSFV